MILNKFHRCDFQMPTLSNRHKSIKLRFHFSRTWGKIVGEKQSKSCQAMNIILLSLRRHQLGYVQREWNLLRSITQKLYSHAHKPFRQIWIEILYKHLNILRNKLEILSTKRATRKSHEKSFPSFLFISVFTNKFGKLKVILVIVRCSRNYELRFF